MIIRPVKFQDFHKNVTPNSNYVSELILSPLVISIIVVSHCLLSSWWLPFHFCFCQRRRIVTCVTPERHQSHIKHDWAVLSLWLSSAFGSVLNQIWNSRIQCDLCCSHCPKQSRFRSKLSPKKKRNKKIRFTFDGSVAKECVAVAVLRAIIWLEGGSSAQSGALNVLNQVFITYSSALYAFQFILSLEQIVCWCCHKHQIGGVLQ